MFAPFGKYFIGAGQVILSPSPFAARIGVVVAGVFLLVLVHRAARMVGTPWAGPITVGTLAIFPPLATHTTSAMLDTVLAAVVFLLFVVAHEQWRSTTAGQPTTTDRQPTTGERGDSVGGFTLGVATVLVCATKAYGVLYAVGPVAAILWIRRRRLGTFRAVAAPAAGAFVSFAIVFAPHILTSPPDYYAGASVPPVVQTVMQTPLVGGIAYAFGASLVHNLTAHGGSTGVQLSAFVGWIVSAGPWPVIGFVLSLVGRWLPERVRVDPWWLPTLVVGVPLVALVVFVPKGFLRYTLPMFPLFAFLVVVVGLRTTRATSKFRIATMVIVGLVLITPALPFVVGGAKLAADSQFEEVSSTAVEGDAGDISIVSQRAIVLRWHLGDHYVESYNFDPTESITLESENGLQVTVSGVDANRQASIERAESALRNGTVTRVVLLGETTRVGSVDVSTCGNVVEQWDRYQTGQRGSSRISVWNVSTCGTN